MGVFLEQLSGCSCRPVCRDGTCVCLDRFGPNYNPKSGQLLPETFGSRPKERPMGPDLELSGSGLEPKACDPVESESRESSCSWQKPIIECNSQCSCASSCSNRVVQKGIRFKLKVGPAGSRGLGVFAIDQIKRLEFVCEYAGEVIGVTEAQTRLQEKKGGMNYVIVLREHYSGSVTLTCVDPRLAGNVGRFANHSCCPNLMMIPVRVDSNIPRLALFARHEICPGEELTFDYSGAAALGGSICSEAEYKGTATAFSSKGAHSPDNSSCDRFYETIQTSGQHLDFCNTDLSLHSEVKVSDTEYLGCFDLKSSDSSHTEITTENLTKKEKSERTSLSKNDYNFGEERTTMVEKQPLRKEKRESLQFGMYLNCIKNCTVGSAGSLSTNSDNETEAIKKRLGCDSRSIGACEQNPLRSLAGRKRTFSENSNVDCLEKCSKVGYEKWQNSSSVLDLEKNGFYRYIQCFCGSPSCKGVLPFDQCLFDS